jgi:prevent-host-death family protein
MDPFVLPTVTVRQLSREPRPVMEEVGRGKRFVVTKHGKPLATLQPIDGYVTHPVTAKESDIFGSPLGSQAHEAAKLSTVEKELLSRAHPLFNRITVGCSDAPSDQLWAGMRSLQLRGMARKQSRGLILTGRGLTMQEWLHQHEPEHR